jgi:hypothetical protein
VTSQETVGHGKTKSIWLIRAGQGKSEVRTIVAATSQKRVAEILGLSLGAVRNYYQESIEAVFQATSYMCEDFIKGYFNN